MTAAMSELAVARATPHQRAIPAKEPARCAIQRVVSIASGERVFERSRTEGLA